MKHSLRGLALAFSLFACTSASGQVTTINSLPTATTPLGGTEKFPIWQSGATKSVDALHLLPDSGVAAGVYGDTTHCAFLTIASNGTVTSANNSASCPGGGGGGTPAGSPGALQYNNAGAFGGLSLGTTTTLLHGNASGAPTFSAVGLTADVTGILPGANGGTGVNNSGKTFTLGANLATTGGATTLALGATGRTYTFPDLTDTVALLTATQTLTNKSIDAGQLTGSIVAGRMPAFTGDATSSAGAVALTFATVNSNVGSFGSSTNCPTITVNGKGLITAASQTACAGGSGTVTSIGLGSGLCSSGSNPITTSGTITPCATINAQTGTSYPTVSGDGGKIVSLSNASPVGVTLSQANTAGFTSGFGLDYSNIGAGAVTITATTSVFDNGLTTLVLTKGQDAFVWSDSTNYHSIVSLPVMAADTVLGNFSATANYPTAAALLSCSTASSALTYNTSTHAWGCNSISGGGGGTFNYSSGSNTIAASTYFAPIGGGGVPVTTEAAVQVNSPAATTIANLKVTLSVDPGNTSTVVVTARKAGSDQTLTCTITGNGTTNKTCSNTANSFNAAAGDLLDWKIVNSASFTGTVNISASNGTSNVGVTSVACGAGLTGGTFTTTGTCALDLAANNVWTGQNSSTPVALTIATATFTPTGATNHYTIGLTSACPCTLANPSATPVAGTEGTIKITQDGTGSRTIGTWGSSYIIEGGTSAISLSTGASAIDTFAYHVFDSTHILLTFASKNAVH